MGETAARRIGRGPVRTPPLEPGVSPRIQARMGIDKDDPTPPVDVKKRTTKVNISMVIAILLFFVVAAAVVLFTRKHPPEPSATKGPTEAVAPGGK